MCYNFSRPGMVFACIQSSRGDNSYNLENMEEQFMKKYFNILLFAGLALLGTSGVANALLVDFTSTDWQGLNGLTTYNKTVYGIDVGISGSGGSLTFNANDPAGDINLDPYLNGWGDGIGIADDEVSNDEILTITFSEWVTGTHIYVLDLFSTEGEGAQFQVGNGLWQPISAPIVLFPPSGPLNKTDWGFRDIALDPSIAFNTLRFKTNFDGGLSDFSVAGVDINPVPEPATMLLFGAGLAGLAGFQNRKRKK